MIQLNIDMTEEPNDEEDRIFLATNQWVGDGYKLVIPHEHVDIASVTAAAAAVKSLASIGQQLANAFRSAIDPVMQSIRDIDEQQMRATHTGLEPFDIHDLQAHERMLHKQEA